MSIWVWWLARYSTVCSKYGYFTLRKVLYNGNVEIKNKYQYILLIYNCFVFLQGTGIYFKHHSCPDSRLLANIFGNVLLSMSLHSFNFSDQTGDKTLPSLFPLRTTTPLQRPVCVMIWFISFLKVTTLCCIKVL